MRNFDPRICTIPGVHEVYKIGYEALSRIRNHLQQTTKKKQQQQQQLQQQQQQLQKNKKHKKEIKIFCAIYTYKGGVKWTNVIWETWGKRL